MSLPYFPLYPTDFDGKTAHLTILEDGAYNRLLRLCWKTPGCRIPTDEAWIMRQMRARSPEEQDAVMVVLEEFFTAKGGFYTNKKLSEIYASSSEAHERRKKAGSKGGRAKSLKTNETGSSNATAKLKQPEPEPEPYIEERNANALRRNSPKNPDPTKVLFDSGVAILTEAGIKEANARSILGKWKKAHGAEAVITAIGRAQREGAIDPVAFIEGCFKFRRLTGADNEDYLRGVLNL